MKRYVEISNLRKLFHNWPFANSPSDLGSITDGVIQKTLKNDT